MEPPLPHWLFRQNTKDWQPPIVWNGGKCPVPEGQKVSVWRGRYSAPWGSTLPRWHGCWCCLIKPERHDWSAKPERGADPILLYRLPRTSSEVRTVAIDHNLLRQIVREEIENVFLQMMGRANG